VKHTLIDRLLGFVAFAVLAAFLGILMWYVPRLDLGAVIVITLLFVAWDFFASHGDRPA
jgi:hypothetical protein